MRILCCALDEIRRRQNDRYIAKRSVELQNPTHYLVYGHALPQMSTMIILAVDTA